MKILMTQRTLVRVGGSQLAAAEISRALAERGHEVTVYSPRIGDLTVLLWSGKVATAATLAEIAWTPDIIHGQHHLPAMAALARFPGVPAIYYCHGRPWVEAAPLHPAIRRYVMMCGWLADSAATEFGLPADAVAVLPNFVNTARFSELRLPAATPSKALLFGDPGVPREELKRLAEACGALGLQFDVLRDKSGEKRPEIVLPDYDIVFAIGRCAIEAMASGCAVIPVIPEQAGELVTPENFDRWSYSNFSPRYFTSGAQIGTDWLRRQLEQYDPAGVAAVTHRVRQERTLDGAVDRLEAIYREALAAPAIASDTAFAPYLEKLATDVDGMWNDNQRLGTLKTRVAHLEKALQRARRRAAKPAPGLLQRLRRRLSGKA